MDRQFVEYFLKKKINDLNNIAFRKIHKSLKNDPTIRTNLNPAFPFPKDIRFGLLKGYLAVEYVGSEQPEDDDFHASCAFYVNLLNFLNIDLSHLHYHTIPIQDVDGIENLNFFLGDSIDVLCDYSYKFSHDTESAVFGGIFDFNSATQPLYISNSTFFWTDQFGNLKVKRVDFLELWPLQNGYWVYPTNPDKLANLILQCPVPSYNIKLHKKLNEFIEFINSSDNNEPAITKFIEENPEILQLSLGVRDLNPQICLEWQYSTTKPNLKPDFMPLGLDGYVDILEFKLPNLKSKPIVGSSTRSQPSHEVDTAIAQINEYDKWCSQEVNQQWLFETKNIRVKHPRKYLVIGHSKDFESEQRQELRETRNVVIITYDELIDMARFQLYRIK